MILTEWPQRPRSQLDKICRNCTAATARTMPYFQIRFRFS